MYLSHGQPIVYYGDEQGFTGDGGDQDARQDMFASSVATYNDDDLIGTDDMTAEGNFNTAHPFYRRLADLSALREEHPTMATAPRFIASPATNPGSTHSAASRTRTTWNTSSPPTTRRKPRPSASEPSVLS